MTIRGSADQSNDGLSQNQLPRTRVQEIQHRPHAQVLIIGGGINGVGTFRDLALQGIDVTLVERGDYCQGASGASSHMIHGGIRYLENGEFRLVRESVVERNGLLSIAPHYVKPLMTMIPIFSTFSGILSAPARFLTHKQGKRCERGAFLIKLGLSIYDYFSRAGGRVPRHKFVGRTKALLDLPALHPDIKYTATYFDASVHNPERLTLDVLQDGLRANPQARSSNYLSAEEITADGVLLKDELTGKTFIFQADVVVNATGAWVDQTNNSLGNPTLFMGGTKGSHMVLNHPELMEACGGREIFFEHTDGRIVLIYPIGDRVLVGTTDIEADISHDTVCTNEEIDYFFDLVSHLFPTIKVSQEDIVFSFSGVRPLPAHDDTQPGFVSRDYRIESAELTIGGRQTPVLSLVGGKWTTFRALSAHLSDEVLTHLGIPRKVSTTTLPIGGGRDFPTTPEAEQGWIEANIGKAFTAHRVSMLLSRYGTRATEVITFLQSGNDQPFASTDELSSREVAFMVMNEQVGHLVDILIRRTSLAFRGLVTPEILEELADSLALELHWDAHRRAEEIKHARDVLAKFHGLRIHDLAAADTMV